MEWEDEGALGNLDMAPNTSTSDGEILIGVGNEISRHNGGTYLFLFRLTMVVVSIILLQCCLVAESN